MKIPVEEQYKFVKLSLPDGSKADGQAVLLHACCAPCSSAIVECMLRNGMKPTVYFSNSNIYPQQEFEIRKHELMRFLEAQGVPYVEDEYDHEEWLANIKGLENEPERGSRCSACFLYRLKAMVGAEYQKDIRTGFWTSAKGITNNDMSYHNIGAAASRPFGGTDSNYEDPTLASVMGNVDYTLYNKYSLSVSMRSDGSSMVGNDHTWGFFPSVSLSWDMKQEKWLRSLQKITMLKLRTG